MKATWLRRLSSERFPDFHDVLALEDVAAERVRQEEKWGDDPTDAEMSDERWLVVLGEEFGEVCRAVLEGDGLNLRDELADVAATALRWLARIKREAGDS